MVCISCMYISDTTLNYIYIYIYILDTEPQQVEKRLLILLKAIRIKLA